MGTQRVASELAVQTTSYSPLVSNSGYSNSASSSKESFKTQTNTGSTLNQGLESALPEESTNPWLNNLNEALANFGEDQLTLEATQKDLPTIESIYPDLSPTTSYKTTTTTRVIYWYHPDYIGNVDLVSDNSGEAYEFFLYSPWGDSLYEWNSGTASFSSPYRFNGKELDEETGLTYYGARYYDNQLGMWLSVDAMAMSPHNMPLTPYHFSANNPVNIIDPDGNDWEITTTRNENDELVINMKYTVAVINSSSKDIDMQQFAESYKSQMESSYGMSYEGKDGSNIHVSMDVDVRVIEDIGELKSNEHILTIKDKSDLDDPNTYGYVNKIGGKEIDINANMVDNMMNGNDNNTLVHETGHTAGLKHIDIRSHAGDQYYNADKQGIHSNNAMFHGGSRYLNDRTSTKINPQQIQWIYNSYKRDLLNLN
jgi:RHS repeat-associated protein